MKCFLSGLLIISMISSHVIAQNVGINNSNPQVSLDVAGALALRPDSIVALSVLINTIDVTDKSYIKFASDNGDANTRLVKLTTGKPGQVLTLEFTGQGAAKLLNGSMHSGGGKVLLASDMVFGSASVISLVFNNNYWKELYRNILPAEGSITSRIYNSGGNYSFTVPPGISQLKVYVTGAGGFGGGNDGSNNGNGGRGGFVSGNLNVTEGETLDVIVGFGGGNGVRTQSTYIKRQAGYLALAAGGGNGSRNGGIGGNGGLVGNNGTYGFGPYVSGSPGFGATATQGGQGGNSGGASPGGSGFSLSGGTVTNYSSILGEGWGADGWFGGGASGTFNMPFPGGNANPYAAGGGGGGSNYTGGLTGTIVNNSTGNLGGSNFSSGVQGMIKIEW